MIAASSEAQRSGTAASSVRGPRRLREQSATRVKSHSGIPPRILQA